MNRTNGTSFPTVAMLFTYFASSSPRIFMILNPPTTRMIVTTRIGPSATEGTIAESAVTNPTDIVAHAMI